MTNNIRNTLQPLDEIFYQKGRCPQKNIIRYVNKLAVLTFVLVAIAVSPASAQDKYHPTETGPPKHKVAELLLPTCRKSFHCRLQRLLKWLQTIEIDIYLDIRFHIHIRMKPEEALNKLSLIEDKLKKQGRMAPIIKAELDALRDMISQG